MKFNKFIILLIIFSILFTMPVSANSTADMLLNEESNPKYDYVAGIFRSLDVIDDEFLRVYKSTQPISNKVAYEVIGDFLGMQLSPQEAHEFVEISEIIRIMMGEALDYPLDIMTDSQIRNAAASCGLSDGVSVNISKSITAGELLQILYNSIFIERYNDSNYIVGSSYAETNNLREVSGVVTANSRTALVTKYGVDEGYITVADEKLSIADGDDLLGYEILAMVDEDNNILSCMKTKKNEDIEIESCDFLGYDGNSIRYENENGRKKYVKLEADFALIYNGVMRIRKTEEILKPEIGNLSLIDNDNDGAYEVVIVWSYKVMRIGTSDVNAEIITSYDGTVQLDLSKIDYEIYLNGQECMIDELKAKQIAYYAYDESSAFASIHSSDKYIDGIIETYSANKTNIVVIDGAEYEIAATLVSKIRLDTQARLYLGEFGRIEFIEYIGSSRYGILRRVYKDMENDDVYRIQFLNDMGEMCDFAVAKKAYFYSHNINKVHFNDYYFDELKYYTERAYSLKTGNYGKGMAAPIFMYTLTADEEIKRISLPTIFDENKIGASREANVLQAAALDTNMLYCSSENLYRQTINGFYATFRNTLLCDNLNKFVDNETLVFEVMVDKNYTPDKEKLEKTKIYTGTQISYTPWRYANFYNLDEGNVAEVVVIYNMSVTTTSTDNMFIVSKAMQVWAEEDATVKYSVTGYINGEEVTYLFDENTVIETTRMSGFINSSESVTLADINRGDVMYISADSENNIYSVSLAMRGKHSASDYNLYHNAYSSDSEIEAMFGKTKRVDGNKVTLTFGTNAIISGMLSYTASCRTANVYIYDGMSVSKGKITDVRVGDFVYLRSREGVVKEVIIWRNNQ